MKNSNQLSSDVEEICNIYLEAKKLHKNDFKGNIINETVFKIETRYFELQVDFNYIKNILQINHNEN